MYETNVASCRIWDALGFKRLGRIRGCGNLKSSPNELVDAIIYGRDLGQDDDFVSEERFDKIRFYLKNGKYPNGADRAEKSRLRSAATHYKLYPATNTEPERLMLKGKEVISDPQRQYEIAREVHHKNHGGINKTTASIAESYHWVRIKETVSQVIRNCPECSEMNKGLSVVRAQERWRQPQQSSPVPLSSHTPTLSQHYAPPPQQQQQPRTLPRPDSPSDQIQIEASQQPQPYTSFAPQHPSYDMPVDPALMDRVHPSLNLEDLPPSPFLTAGQNLSMPPIPSLDLPVPNLPDPKPPIKDDVTMTGTGERAPTAREELRRRLTRAGYGKQ